MVDSEKDLNVVHATKAQKSEKLRIEPVQVVETTLSIINNEQTVDDRFRIIYISEKTGTFDIDGVLFPWVAPCVLCLSETASIKIPTHTKESAAKCTIFYFHPHFLNKRLTFENVKQHGMNVEPEIIENRLILSSFTHTDKLLLNHISPEDGARIKNLMKSCETELTQQQTGWWPCRTRSYLTELLFLLAQLYESSKNKQEQIPSVNVASPDFKPVLDYVMRYYNTPLTLDKIAANFATNRTSLNERFKSETGMTAIAYIIDLRLRVASSMLENTDLPVAEIAERTGHSDTTHFERLFKRKYDCAPASYRAQIKKSAKTL